MREFVKRAEIETRIIGARWRFLWMATETKILLGVRSRELRECLGDCSKERSLVSGAKDYSYLNATMGSTRMARRAGM